MYIITVINKYKYEDILQCTEIQAPSPITAMLFDNNC